MVSYSGNNTHHSIPMLVLALYPILGYYVFAGQLDYAEIAGIIVLTYAIYGEKFTVKIIPNSYIIYWVYSALQMYFIAGIAGWSDYIPGGINLMMFSLFLFGFAATFNLDSLYNYMRWVFVLASILLILQLFIYYFIHIKISFFLPLGHQLTYIGMTYEELVSRQVSLDGGIIERFSSFFTEPSHFAQYGLLLLSLELFRGENKDKLFTKFSGYIVFTLFLIQAGSGFIGMLSLAIVKIIYILFVTRQKKYYFYLAVLIPLLAFVANLYMKSSSGTYISERTVEMGEYNDRDQTGSTFVRLYYGWYAYDDLDSAQKMMGTSRNYVQSLREAGFFNGVTYVLCSQGLIGLLLLIYFYFDCCRKRGVYSTALIIIFLVISLFGGTYMTAIMMITSAVLLGTKWATPELGR